MGTSLTTDSLCPRCGQASLISGKDGDIIRLVCLTDNCNFERETPTTEIKSIMVEVPTELVEFLIDKLANTPCSMAGYRESRILAAIGEASRKAGLV